MSAETCYCRANGLVVPVLGFTKPYPCRGCCKRARCGPATGKIPDQVELVLFAGPTTQCRELDGVYILERDQDAEQGEPTPPPRSCIWQYTFDPPRLGGYTRIVLRAAWDKILLLNFSTEEYYPGNVFGSGYVQRSLSDSECDIHTWADMPIDSYAVSPLPGQCMPLTTSKVTSLPR